MGLEPGTGSKRFKLSDNIFFVYDAKAGNYLPSDQLYKNMYHQLNTLD
jgi:hypothetical protein